MYCPYCCTENKAHVYTKPEGFSAYAHIKCKSCGCNSEEKVYDMMLNKLTINASTNILVEKIFL